MSKPGEKNQYAPNFDQLLMTTRMIVFALMAGLTTFLVVVLFVVPKPAKPMSEQRLLTYMSIGVLALSGILSAVVPGMVVSKVVGDLAAEKTAALAGVRDRASRQAAEVKTDPTPRLLALFQTTTIIAAALREGPGFVALAAYMVERSYIALAVGGLSILALAFLIPTAGRLENWLADQTGRIEQASQGVY